MNRLERSSSSKDYGVENSGEKTILTTNNNYEDMTADVQRPRNTIDDLKTFKYIYTWVQSSVQYVPSQATTALTSLNLV